MSLRSSSEHRLFVGTTLAVVLALVNLSVRPPSYPGRPSGPEGLPHRHIPAAAGKARVSTVLLTSASARNKAVLSEPVEDEQELGDTTLLPRFADFAFASALPTAVVKRVSGPIRAARPLRC